MGRAGNTSTFPVGLVANTEPAQNGLKEAEAGESGEQEVKADQGREQEPARVDPEAQHGAGKHQDSSEDAEGIFDTHRGDMVWERFADGHMITLYRHMAI